ncbi:hypothetical protein FRC96_12910 [Lujinxingia vulgaris]|uniref:Uncharacterized protein n=1 Tax=Lujinxingia vulgaris TaxID=2600176 RepID=A0A5C6X2J7_9DELT|nr:hypothetical protein [Lujinxingia vulgaris]TXD34519.1 hypothetical protein FRC96_12910 [Lujinxingia vulgaris]
MVQAFHELDHHSTLKGLADHGAINYGIAGAGAMILGNRQGIGPNKDCINCKFEEFFMASWPKGEPALNVRVDESGKAVEALWPDDPSNVYHSYVRDPVRIRNLHAGPRAGQSQSPTRLFYGEPTQSVGRGLVPLRNSQGGDP